MRPCGLTIALAMTLLAAPGSGGQPEKSASPSAFDAATAAASHRRMVEVLAAGSGETRVDNPYFGLERLNSLVAQAAALTDSAPWTQRGPILYDVAMEEFRLGSVDAAIRSLEQLQQILPSGAALYQNRILYTLGLAYLRKGERTNCVGRHNRTSCLLPLRPEAVHVDKSGSRGAVTSWTKMLEGLAPKSPDAAAGRWLLNIAYMTLGEYPDGVPKRYLIPPERFLSDAEVPRFDDVAGGVGLATFDLAGGVAVEDFDGDGLLDVVTSTWEPSGPMKVFINRGDGRFENHSDAAHLEGITGGLNLVSADYDNDGDVDILVLRGAWMMDKGQHPNSLLRNEGDATFTDVTIAAGMGERRFPTQTAGWADFDLDGDLDLYIGNESRPRDGYPSQLFRNNGNGTFTDVASAAGVENLRYSKGVSWGDYDGDRDPDLYVSNFRSANRLYRNNGDGTFTDVAGSLGVAGPDDTFATWFWDYDNDGRLDLFVAGYQLAPAGPQRLYPVVNHFLHLGPTRVDTDRLYRGRDGGFDDVTHEMGLARVTMPMGANFGDIDNDGFSDIYLGTGYPPYDALMPSVLYRNDSAMRFLDVTASAGMGHLQKGHGIAFADLDNDGDQDVFAQMGGLYPDDGFTNSLFENPGFGNHWIRLRLVGVQSNRSAVGARIRADIIENGRARSVYRQVGTGGSFGANPLLQHLGLGSAVRIERLEIHWPVTDERQVFDSVAADQTIEVIEGHTSFRVLEMPRFKFVRVEDG